MFGPLLVVALAELVLRGRRELVLVLIEHRHAGLCTVRIALRSIRALICIRRRASTPNTNRCR